jgi:hypothetical protein
MLNSSQLTLYQYSVPNNEAEEEAIATRALRSKNHKDFATGKATPFYPEQG